jgi:hypothetical protein
MVIYNTKEEAKAVLRNKELPFGASIILNTKDGDLLGVQGKSKMKFLDMNTLPPTNGKSNQVLKLDENGNVVWAADDMRDIVDDLISTDTDKALSANMGKYLQDNKLDNEIIAGINIITGHAYKIINNKLNIEIAYRNYSKDNNTFDKRYIDDVVPEASGTSTGVMSIDHYNLLANIVTNASTNINGLIHKLTNYSYSTNTVTHNSSILYKASTGTWSTANVKHTINAATTTTAGVMSAADKVKLENTVSATTTATPDTLGLVKQAADLTDLQADTDLEGVKAQFNQLLANLRAAGIMYQTPQP